MATNKVVEFKVNGIHCGGCANKIKTQFNNLNVEHNVDVNVENGLVKVEFNSNEATISQFRDGIANCGFQVESVELK